MPELEKFEKEHALERKQLRKQIKLLEAKIAKESSLAGKQELRTQRTTLQEELKVLEPAKRLKKQILAKRHRMNEEQQVKTLEDEVTSNDLVI